LSVAKIRIKSQWFRPGADKTPEQTASAMAFIAWRVAQNMLKQMRWRSLTSNWEQYFAFTREVLVFLTQVLDRMAYASACRHRGACRICDGAGEAGGRDIAGQRRRFAGRSSQRASPATYEQFIDLFNELSDHYADFGFDTQGPDLTLCVIWVTASRADAQEGPALGD
jgi:hypothetical protein